MFPVFKMPAPAVSALERGFYELEAFASDNVLADWQKIRIVLDRPIETGIAVELPPEYGIDNNLGDNSYLISREDPAYVRVIIPQESCTDWEGIFRQSAATAEQQQEGGQIIIENRVYICREDGSGFSLIDECPRACGDETIIVDTNGLVAADDDWLEKLAEYAGEGSPFECRGCGSTDVESISLGRTAKDCLRYEGGEWEDGVCTENTGRSGPPFICELLISINS